MPSLPNKLKIAIIGAGVMGLTTANRIKDTLPDAELTIYAEKFSPETISDVSTGYWEPFTYNDRDASKHSVLTWGKETYDKLIEIGISPEASDYGVQIVSTFVLSSQMETKEPFWAKNVLLNRKIEDDEMTKLGLNKHARSGFNFMCPIIDMKRFLSHLQAKLEHKGGVKFFQRHVNSVAELIGIDNRDNYSFVINCTQNPKSVTTSDKSTRVIEAHVLIVDAPWIKIAYAYQSHQQGSTYILPSQNKVVLSGTTLSQETLEGKSSDPEQLFNRCVSICPSLKNAQVTSKHVYSWEAREGGLRLEMEKHKLESEAGGDVKIIHNYGHGGSGITLCYGCAGEVARLVQENTKKK